MKTQFPPTHTKSVAISRRTSLFKKAIFSFGIFFIALFSSSFFVLNKSNFSFTIKSIQEAFVYNAFAEDGSDNLSTNITFTPVPSTLSVYGSAPGGARVFYPTPVATQYVNGSFAGNPLVSCNPASGATFPYGVTNVRCSAYNMYTGTIESVSFMVIVLSTDVTPPVITLNGNNPLHITQDSPLIDPGAHAQDNIDGDISSNVMASGVVNTSSPGTYTLTYYVSDMAGNQATPVVRTIVIDPKTSPPNPTLDVTAPIITLNGNNPFHVMQGSIFTEPGAHAEDNVDGDISASISITGSVDISNTGVYTLTYNVSDKAGNRANSVVRTVIVDPSNSPAPDTTPPVITITGANPITIFQNATYTDQGATALDAVDGIVPVTATGTVDTTTLGTYTITYTASDTSNNTASALRTVNVVASSTGVDVTPPSVPTLLGATTTATSTGVSTILASWFPSVDNVALLGYSFIFDHSTSTIPDIIVDIATTSISTLLADGTWYLHIIAIDTSFNTSSVATLGPISLSTALAGDTVPPVGPTTVTSSTHTVDATSSAQVVNLTWDQATDDTAVAGYSYLWDTNGSSTPDSIVESSLLNASSVLPNGIWYFHIRSVDTSGNMATSTVDFGPIIIDTATSTGDVTPPVGPTLITSSSHTQGVLSTAHNVDVAWDDATDDVLVAGYSYTIDTSATGTAGTVVNVMGTSTSFILPDGTFYFHVNAVDTSGNVSPVVTFGPIIVATTIGGGDTTPPTTPVVTFTKTGTSTLTASWTESTDNVALAGYSILFGTSASSTVDSVIETSATTSSVVVPDGSWYFHLVAVDTSLNTSSPVTEGPLVIDTHPPVITLLGSSTMSVATGTPFVDPGAQAFDTIDGNLTSSIVATGTVDTTTVGTYIITYSVTDASLNSAVPVSRTVHVLSSPDIIAPVITLIGSSTEIIFQGSPYIEKGATALDAVDGDVTQYVSVGGTVDTTTLGSYSVVYTVGDSSGNIASTTRTVQVVPLIFHTIFAAKTGQGSISPSGTTTLVEGTNQTYTLTPNYGYELVNLLVDGTSTATTSSYVFNNIVSDHTIYATYTPLPARPAFIIVASSSSNGTITPAATSSILQGDDLLFVIDPDVGYYIDTLLIDNVSVATTTTYVLANVNANHAIVATFAAYPPDVTPPTAVTIASSSHTQNTPSSNPSFSITWNASTDNESGVAGYSFVLDNSTTTNPDTIVDSTTTTVTQSLASGSWYFHIRAVDNVGNVSSVVHFGPVLITDSAVTLINSFVNGTYYASYAPTLASSSELGITGTTSVRDSNLISPFTLVDSMLVGVTASSSSLTRVTANTSFFYNSSFTNCTITNSTLKNYTGSNCTISDSILDPVGVTNDVTGSTISGFSSIYVSDVLYSTVTGSYIATSTVTFSTLTNSTSTNSTIASSTLVNSTVDLSTILSSTLTRNTITGSTVRNSLLTDNVIASSTIMASTLHDAAITDSVLGDVTIGVGASSVTISGSHMNGTTILGTSTSITDSTVGSTTIINAVINGNIIYSGTILLPDGSPVVITVPTPVTLIINSAPVVQVTTSTNLGTLTIVDTSSDANATTSPYLNDSWVYTINYGDGAVSTSSVATLGATFTHTYVTSGTYTVIVTVTDAYGASTSYLTTLLVSITGGGGGGGQSVGGGGGWLIYTPPVASSTLYSLNSFGGTTSTGTLATTTVKVITKKPVLKKSSSTFSKSPSKQTTKVLPVATAFAGDSNDEKRFCEYVPSKTKIDSWKSKIQKYLNVISVK